MSWNLLVGSTLAATVIVGIGACTGTLDSSAGDPAIVGQRAELVFKKKEWLKTYDENCDVCFQAFELCERGAAEDEAILDACQVALDSCVRGGLVNDDEGEVDDEEDEDGDEVDEEDEDVDAGVDDEEEEEDEDVDVDLVGDDDDDAGVDDEADDDGVDVDLVGDDDEDDEDVDVDEAIDEATGVEDGDGDGEPGDQVKQDLVEDVRLCLDQGNTCLQGGGDFRDCLRALKACVAESLDNAFDDVCTGQLNMCIAEQSPEEVVQSIEQLCDDSIDDNDNDDGA